MAEAASQTNLNQTIRLHHVGYVVQSINEVAHRFAQSICSVVGSSVFQDPLQDAKVTFLASIVQEFPLVNWWNPSPKGIAVINFLKRGGGLHHLCYMKWSPWINNCQFSRTIRRKNREAAAPRRRL